MGEQTTRYTQGRDDWIDVCALCIEAAIEQGWTREGSPTIPVVTYPDRRRRRFTLRGFVDGRRAQPEPQAEPMLRRLTGEEQAMVEAADLFNNSPYRRTVAGIARSLGDPRVSLVPLSGVNPEVVVTVAWDISWYQYRVSFDSSQAVRLAERGYEVDELSDRFKAWNGSLEAAGQIVPDIPRF